MKLLPPLLLLVLAAGCSRGPDLQPVSGLININHQPLQAGVIRFSPRAGTEGRATSAGVHEGEFAISRKDGLLAGEYRVEIEADIDLGFDIDDDVAFAGRGGKPLPPNPVPLKFNRNSTLTASVVRGERNLLEIDLEVPQPTR